MRIYVILLMALAAAQASLRAQPPTITNQPASQALWAGGNVTFAVGVSGTGPFTYQWQLNNTNLPNGIITTVAGNGILGYSGDGGAATNARLDAPHSVAVDASGSLFIADYDNQRIRTVNTNGIIRTVAGNGTAAYAGDGGAATNASLSWPEGVAVDATGNLFIADCGNSVIRKVDTNGIITTIAGGGTMGYSGDGGPATNASLSYPFGVTVDGLGNLFIADYYNNCIRKVSTNGIIRTVAGNGTNGYSGDGGPAINARLNWPNGVTTDVPGNLFVADTGNNVIRKVDTNGIITTVVGNGTNGYSGDGGAATNASLSEPKGVSLDASGNLFIADYASIRKVDTNGIISTVAGTGFGFGGNFHDGIAATNTSLYYPSGVAVDASGNLFIAVNNNGSGRIRKVTNTQGPTLALNNVTAANAGNYQLVVTGPDGSVTSSVATLIVATSPLVFRTVHNSDGNLALNFVSQPNSTNVVLCATNLSPPVVWQPLSTNMAGANGNWQYTDTNAANWRAGFYRSLTP